MIRPVVEDGGLANHGIGLSFPDPVTRANPQLRPGRIVPSSGPWYATGYRHRL